MATRITPRWFDGALLLPNATGSITATTAASLVTSQKMTFMFWVKPQAGVATPRRHMAKYDDANNNYQIGISPSRNFYVDATYSGVRYQSGGTSDQALTNNDWAHIAAVFDTNAWTIYINGIDVTSGSGVSAAISSASTDFFIGKSAGGNNATGTFTDVRFYQRALTALEVKGYYYNAIEPSTTSLGVWYKMSDASTSTITDASGNSNTGTVVAGAVCTYDTPLKPRLTIRDFGACILSTTVYGYTTSIDYDPGSASFSFGLWFRRAKQVSGSYTLMSKGQLSNPSSTNLSYGLFVGGNNLITFRCTKDGSTNVKSVTSSVGFTDVGWHHIALVYTAVADGTSIGDMYIDGVHTGNATNFPLPVFSNTHRLGINEDFTDANVAGFTPVGGVDEAFWYKGALNLDMIRKAMMLGPSIAFAGDANLYGCWLFDENTGTTVADQSARGNALTLNASSGWSTDTVTTARSAATGRGDGTSRGAA